MGRVRQKEPGIATVREALELRTVDDLKQLLSFLPVKERPTRKGDLINLIERQLAGERLRELWERLEDIQQKAVTETIYSDSPVFNATRFRAKYGAAPVSGGVIDEWDDAEIDEWDYIETPGLLRLFLYSNDRYNSSASAILPDDLKARLSQFASRPEPLRLRGEDELPEFVEQVEKDHEFYEDEQGIPIISGNRASQMSLRKYVEDVVHRIPLVRRDTERAAQQDLLTMLRLVDKGKVSVSDKTFQPSLASMQEIAPLLRDGDFYGRQWKMETWER